MSVLIKGMEMPMNCYDCPLFESIYHLHGCHAVPKSFDDMDMWNFAGDDRPLWCPLVSVTPHGRLIDADALSSKLTDLAECEWNQSTGTTWAEAFEEVDGFVQDAPTIIEAEEK